MQSHPIYPPMSHDVTLHCLDPRGRPLELESSFGYDPADPYAVWVTFHAVDGEVCWGFARTLLIAGTTSPAGSGDVRIWPSIDEDARAVVVMEFRSPDGRLVAQALTEDIQAFLAPTMVAVPPGTESRHLDVDALVHALLADSASE